MNEIDVQKLNNFLYIKTNNGKTVQIRNAYRFECYSKVAFFRLYNRVFFKSCISYREKVKMLLTSKKKIWLSKKNYEVSIYSPKSLEIYSNLDCVGLRNKLNINVCLLSNTLHIDCNNIYLIRRFLLFVLCDFIDLSAMPVIKCSKSVLFACLDWVSSQKIVLDNWPNYIEHYGSLSYLLKICGIIENEGVCFPEPYRSDLVMSSQILNDVLSAGLCFCSVPQKYAIIPQEKNKYEIAQKAQVMLNAVGYFYTELEVAQGDSHQNAIKIIKFDSRERQIKYPHQRYSFLYDSKQKQIVGVCLWKSGRNININGFAEDVRRFVDLLYFRKTTWDFSGEIINGYFLNKKIAKLWSRVTDTYFIGDKECQLAFAEVAL